MNYKLFPLVVIFFYCYQVHSQRNIDSVNIQYVSDFEKKTIRETVLKNEFDESFIGILLAIDSTSSASKVNLNKERIYNFLTAIQSTVEKSNEKKKIKILFREVHDNFFKKYELDSYFGDVFDSATYNCVTGSALYAYIFDWFDIPYQIKETPTHVFIVAYPKSHNIYVETTIPGKGGSYVPSEALMKRAVDELIDLKMITSQQVGRDGYTKTFNDYYYGNENISKRDLIGIQYYNKSISLLNQEKYYEAYWSILKAGFFYEKEKARLLSDSILFIAVENTDFEKLENFEWFLELARVIKDIDFLKYKLLKIISNELWGDGELNTIETYLKSITQVDVKNQLLETFYSFRAERYSKLQLHNNTLEYAKKIYDLNPNNLLAKSYIGESNILRLSQMNLTEQRISDLNELKDQYPFLVDFAIYNRYKIYLYSYLTASAFDKNNKKEGLGYLNVLETLVEKEQKDGVSFSQEAVGNAYGSIGAFYYRNKDKASAIEYLNKGLEYSPDNNNIQRKIELIQTSY